MVIVTIHLFIMSLLSSGKNLHLINAVTILREPKARMISAFLYGIHNAGGWVVDNDYIHNYHRDIHECYTR